MPIPAGIALVEPWIAFATKFGSRPSSSWPTLTLKMAGAGGRAGSCGGMRGLPRAGKGDWAAEGNSGSCGEVAGFGGGIEGASAASKACSGAAKGDFTNGPAAKGDSAARGG